jgi:hypothetical protein
MYRASVGGVSLVLSAINNREVSDMGKLDAWRNSGKYLPEPLRDFHAQKDFFKAMHHAYREDDPRGEMPTWVTGHIYTVDWFLWYIAARGYTLQKTRTQGIEFLPWPDSPYLNSGFAALFAAGDKP